jgi:hypothetical protein
MLRIIWRACGAREDVNSKRVPGVVKMKVLYVYVKTESSVYLYFVLEVFAEIVEEDRKKRCVYMNWQVSSRERRLGIPGFGHARTGIPYLYSSVSHPAGHRHSSMHRLLHMSSCS